MTLLLVIRIYVLNDDERVAVKDNLELMLEDNISENIQEIATVKGL